MRTTPKDYLYSAVLIGLILCATALFLVVTEGWLAPILGSYTPIAMLALLALSYGGFTALVLSIISAWLPLIEGDYAMDHPQFLHWKVRYVVGELGNAGLSLFFPTFANAAFYSLLGARVGKQVAIGGKIVDPRLTVLEDYCVLGEGCIVASHTMVQDRFLLKTVHVGKGATVGVGSIVMLGVKIGPGAIVLPGSVLKAGTEVPAGEIWGGIPAERIRMAKN
jgi:acetyltransferase-like isoleucine patch superfamily enzyme